jgi:Cys-Gly metallodipeptidase DUG1
VKQSDNTWLTPRKPAVTYGLRGIIYYAVTVCGPIKDLHSGEFGGMVHEPLGDLIRLLGTLVESNGQILVPKVYEQVEVLTSEERSVLFTPLRPVVFDVVI